MEQLYEVRTIHGKAVYTVQSHHHVLFPWSMVRQNFATAPDLITLDHHTDTIPAFQGHIYDEFQGFDRDRENMRRLTLLNEIDWRLPETVNLAIARLRHDEHIHAAAMAGIINYAFVVNLNGFGTSSIEEDDYRDKYPSLVPHFDRQPSPTRPFTYRNPESKIFEIPYDCVVGCTKIPHDDECNLAHCSQVLEASYLTDQLDRAQEMAICVGIPALEAVPYILDIDLDFFHTHKALAPDDSKVFHRLIRNAVAITVAVEEGCTTNLWIDSDPPKISTLLEALYGHFKAALQP